MTQPIKIDLTGLKGQLGLTDEQINQLTETCVNVVAAKFYADWQALAKQELKSSAEEYLRNLILVDKGRFEKQIVLTGIVPNMIEQGASAFDMKEGFKKSSKVRYTIPIYKTTKNGQVMVHQGGKWYLTIPFRIGVPGTLGQAGFSSIMPQEVYNAMRANGGTLNEGEVPVPWDAHQQRAALPQTQNNPYYAAYTHKSSIFAGLTRRTAQYGKTTQNTYGTFRRAGENSDPLSWIHKGIQARGFAEKERERMGTELKQICTNELNDFMYTLFPPKNG